MAIKEPCLNIYKIEIQIRRIAEGIFFFLRIRNFYREIRNIRENRDIGSCIKFSLMESREDWENRVVLAPPWRNENARDWDNNRCTIASWKRTPRLEAGA